MLFGPCRMPAASLQRGAGGSSGSSTTPLPAATTPPQPRGCHHQSLTISIRAPNGFRVQRAAAHAIADEVSTAELERACGEGTLTADR